jgi:magnesium transporter
MDSERIVLRELLSQDPADIAEILGELSDEQAGELLHRLYLGGAAAKTLAEMDPEESAELMQKLDRQMASTILARMDPDDAVDLLEELPVDVRKELLSRLSRHDAKLLTDLLAYPADTAGGLMTPEVVALSLSMTAQDAIDVLRQRQEKAGTVYYAYAVDNANHLQGVLSLRDIALARPDRSLGELVIRDAVSVRVDQDVEDVAKLFDKYDFFALPVVDAEDRLLGVITVDDVIDVIREEATEDIYRLASVPSAEGVDTSWWDSFRLRLPWLYGKLVAGLLAALVVGVFEQTIVKVAALAVVMGVIVGQGGASGMQTATIITRGMALGEIDRARGWRLLSKEVLLGLVNGLLLGGTVGLIMIAWKGEALLGVAVGIAMLLNVVVAGMIGVLIPLFLRAIGRDPAAASSLVLTAITDVLGFALLFVLAGLLLPALR